MTRLPLTYCSFATDDRCLGVLILEGELNALEAALAAHMRRLNPGGELVAVTVPTDIDDRQYCRLLENRNRLLSPPEARELLDARPLKEWGL